MTLLSRLAVAAAIGVVAPVALSTPAMAQALSADVGKPLRAAQSAAASGNTGAAMASINAARAAADSPAERTAVAKMAAYVHTRAGQYSRAAQELESVGAPASQLAPLYYQAGNCQKAITLARKAGQQTVVAQCQIKEGDFKGAVATYEKLVKANPSNRNYLENLAGAQYKAGDKKAYLETTERLIRVDPSPARWKALLVDMKSNSMSRDAKLALFQLMQQTNNISRPEDYQEFAKLAIVSNQPGVAKQALDKASEAKVITPSDSMMATLIKAAAERAAQANATLPRLPKTPAGRFQAGETLLGAGNYPAAAAQFDAAIKGGHNADEARVLQGIALVRAGQAAQARNAFKAVAPSSPFADIAALWALYASTKSA